MRRFDSLEQVKKGNPLVHNITNIVVAGDLADGLLAIGASPIMASALEEVAEMAENADVLVMNIGTLDAELVRAMKRAGTAANEAGKPVVLDPVGVGATSFRREVVAELLETIRFTAIRGNASEMAVLAGVEWQGRGVDAGSGYADQIEIARQVAKKHKTIAVLSGASDVISDGKRFAKITNGSSLLPRITGSGCLLSAVCGAFIATLPIDAAYVACLEACASYAVASEFAEESLSAKNLPGSFRPAFLDALANWSKEAIQEHAFIEEGSHAE